jgi:hypothetical protein
MPSSAPDKGLNDLQTLHPLIAAEAFGWDPQDVKAGSSKKKTWKCHLGHIYEATPKHRTLGGTGCPLKRWIKHKVGAIPGTSENWSTTSVEVRSLAELKRISEVETDLF